MRWVIQSQFEDSFQPTTPLPSSSPSPFVVFQPVIPSLGTFSDSLQPSAGLIAHPRWRRIVIGCSKYANIALQSRITVHINRPFPSCVLPLFQTESKCEIFHMKMSMICIRMDLWVKFIFIWKVSHLDSFWNRGKTQLGNGLLPLRFRSQIPRLTWQAQALERDVAHSSVAYMSPTGCVNASKINSYVTIAHVFTNHDSPRAEYGMLVNKQCVYVTYHIGHVDFV